MEIARLLFLTITILHSCYSNAYKKPSKSYVYRANHDAMRQKIKLQSNVFSVTECDEITVEGAGYVPSNGVYVRSNAPLPLGGIPEYGYFCKNNNCTLGVINQW
jgi:hypothetical protein